VLHPCYHHSAAINVFYILALIFATFFQKPLQKGNEIKPKERNIMKPIERETKHHVAYLHFVQYNTIDHI